MMSSHKKLGTGLVLAAALTIGAGYFAPGAESAPPFGTKADVTYSKNLWAALEKARLVGKNSINTRPYEGQAPHGAICATKGNAPAHGE